MRHVTNGAFILLLVGTALLGWGVPDVQAQTVLYVNDDASGAEDGSESDPYATLQDALEEAANGSGAHEIRVAEGIYYPDEGGSASDDDREATFDLAGDLTVKGGYSDGFASRDPSTHLTVLSGDLEQNDVADADGLVTDPANDISGDNSYRVVTATTSGATILLDGVTITAGNADEGGSFLVKNSGGGLYCIVDMEIRDVRFIGNQAKDGGGLAISGANPTITDVVVEHNAASLGNGGGLQSSGDPILTRVTFRSNTTPFGNGAGMNVTAGTPVLRDVLLEDNQAGGGTSTGHGGGMSTVGNGTLKNVIFRNNLANEGDGGGLYVSGSSSDMTLDGVLFDNNESGDGGGMAAVNGSIVLTDVIFRDNTTTSGSGAAGGGGLRVAGGSTTSDLTRVRFEQNTTAYDGGGMVTDGGTHTLQDVHFLENTADFDGGGLSNDASTVTVVSAAFRGNEGANGAVLNENGAEVTLVNAVLSGNVSTSTSVGTIVNDYGTATLKNVVVTGNESVGLQNGGFASDPSTMTIHNSIIYENVNTGFGADEVLNQDGGTMTFEHTLVRGGLGGSHVDNDTGSGATLNDNGGNTSGDPLFVTAVSSGQAPTTNGDFHLQDGSPALGAGSNALLAADAMDVDLDNDTSEDLPFDLDGRARIEGTVDLGPYESGGGLPQVTQSLSAGDDAVSLPDYFGMDLTFETLGADTDVTATYDPAAESGTLGLPDDQGLALTALWTIEFNPEPVTSDLEATVCFDLDDLYLPTVDRSALNVYARSGPSATDWSERTPTELRPSADEPEQLCLTGQNAFSQLAVTADESELPVELVAFDAAVIGETVRLTWQTAGEANNSGFEVERNVEGQWQTLGFVEGAGTTHQPQDYRFTDGDIPYAADRAVYRLRQIDTDGAFEYSAEVEIQLGQPERLALHGNHPNPFAGQTTIRYELSAAGHVRLTVYDVLGRAVAVLVDRGEQAGRKEHIFDGGNLPSGQYFVRLEAGDQVRTEQITIVR